MTKTKELNISEIITKSLAAYIIEAVKEETTKQVKEIKESLEVRNKRMLQCEDNFISASSSIYEYKRKVTNKIKQLQDEINSLKINSNLQSEDIAERIKTTEQKVISIATSEAVQILRLNKTDFLNWTRRKVAEIAAKKNKSTNIIYRELYNQFSENAAAEFIHNFEFCYSGTCKLTMIAELKESPLQQDKELCFEFVQNILKMSA